VDAVKNKELKRRINRIPCFDQVRKKTVISTEEEKTHRQSKKLSKRKRGRKWLEKAEQNHGPKGLDKFHRVGRRKKGDSEKRDQKAKVFTLQASQQPRHQACR